MPSYLEIAVNVPQVKGVFHYHVPPELEGKLQAGHLVEVPFGKQRVQGVVLRAVSEPAVADTRPVFALIDSQPVVTAAQIRLAQDLAHERLASLASFIDLMLPPGLGQQADILYNLKEPAAGASSASLAELQRRLLALIEKRGPLRGRQLDQAFSRIDWRPAARQLIRRGILVGETVLPPPAVQPKSVRTVQLACPVEVAEMKLDDLGKRGTAALARRQAIMRYLMSEPGPVDVAWVYAESGGNLADLRRLSELGLVSLGESEVWRDPLDGLDFQPSQPPPLTSDQQACWLEIQKAIRAAADGQPAPPFLLHGVTGSGKTEIYLHAVAETIRMGRQAAVLVPEIALTPQTVRRFVSRFPGRVGLVHSRLSAGERFDTWRRARSGDLSVVVGPRSALFTPLPNLGLIVLDECHDDSYYQSDPPFYHTVQAATAYAKSSNAVCLLGSATPDVASTHKALQGQWRYLRLPARILAHRQAVHEMMKRLERETPSHAPARYRPLEAQAETTELPTVNVVDMRQELLAGNRSIFSRDLQSALASVLDRQQQAILFLNRRGTASYVFCRDCGFVLKCPRCDLPLTYHQRAADLPLFEVAEIKLICHHCSYQRNSPKTCPDCGSSHIRQYGTGTERVEAEVKKLFPKVRTLRWDYETTRHKGAHDIILSHFAAHRADILVGTQMLAKGLDLPLVTLVGVVLADVGLNMPDAFAGERSFQLLTQVAGRAGRSPLGGEVILQTFQPDHYVIRAAAGHDYQSFYKQELDYRRRLGYPPFGRLVRLEHRHTDPSQAEATAQETAAQIRNWLAREDRRATEMIGPAPCFFARVGGLYRWQIILRGPDPASLLRKRPLGDWRIEVDPPSLL